MKCSEIIKQLEALAPVQYAEHWDNVGLLVGSDKNEINKIMVALDATDSVITQAVNEKVDLLITHHPMIFSAMKRITEEDFIGKKIIELIQHDISYYAMHTNCDVCVMNQIAADKIGLLQGEVLEPIKENKELGILEGIGKYGVLKEAQTMEQLAKRVKEAFGIDSVRMTGEKDKKVKKVAISTGAGKSLIPYALKAGVDVLVTGDIDHHVAIDARDQGLLLIDAGHFGTEHFMVDFISDYIEKTFSMQGKVYRAKEQTPFTQI